MAAGAPAAAELFATSGFARAASLRMLDLTAEVWTDDPDAGELVAELYAPLEGSGAAPHTFVLGRAPVEGGSGYFAAVDGSVIVRTPARGIAFANLVFEMNQLAIETTAGVRLHAAAAALGEGAVVLPGAMGAGKSTLVAGLVRRGLDYITDEVVAVAAETGGVRPYAKPISLGHPPVALGAVSWAAAPPGRVFLGATGLVPATALGTVCSDPTPLRLVVLPTYGPGARTHVEQLRGGEAVAAIAAHTFHLDQPATLPRLATFVADVPVLRLVSGDLDEACTAVLDALAGVRGSTAPGAGVAITDRPLARGRDDAAIVDGSVVVFAAGEVHVLNGGAGLIWDACTGRVSLAEIARDLAAQLGHAETTDARRGAGGRGRPRRAGARRCRPGSARGHQADPRTPPGVLRLR